MFEDGILVVASASPLYGPIIKTLDREGRSAAMAYGDQCGDQAAFERTIQDEYRSTLAILALQDALLNPGKEDPVTLFCAGCVKSYPDGHGLCEEILLNTIGDRPNDEDWLRMAASLPVNEVASHLLATGESGVLRDILPTLMAREDNPLDAQRLVAAIEEDVAAYQLGYSTTILVDNLPLFTERCDYLPSLDWLAKWYLDREGEHEVTITGVMNLIPDEGHVEAVVERATQTMDGDKILAAIGPALEEKGWYLEQQFVHKLVDRELTIDREHIVPLLLQLGANPDYLIAIMRNRSMEYAIKEYHELLAETGATELWCQW